MRNKAPLLLLAAIVTVGTSLSSNSAEIGHMATSVTRLVIQPGFWGGCAARVTPALSTTSGLGACDPNYVTFDCDGATGLSTKSEAASKLSNAQLSMVAGYRFYVKVDPDVTLNSVCYAVRADTLP